MQIFGKCSITKNLSFKGEDLEWKIPLIYFSVQQI